MAFTPRQALKLRTILKKRNNWIRTQVSSSLLHVICFVTLFLKAFVVGYLHILRSNRNVICSHQAETHNHQIMLVFVTVHSPFSMFSLILCYHSYMRRTFFFSTMTLSMPSVMVFIKIQGLCHEGFCYPTNWAKL